MKTILALSLAAILLGSAGAAPAFANSGASALCGPDAPEGYKRPGGFCDQLDDTSSLVDPGSEGNGLVEDDEPDYTVQVL